MLRIQCATYQELEDERATNEDVSTPLRSSENISVPGSNGGCLERAAFIGAHVRQCLWLLSAG